MSYFIDTDLPTLDEAIARADLTGAHAPFLDNRLGARLAIFVPISRWPELGIAPSASATDAFRADFDANLRPWTPTEIEAQVSADLAFAFQKALDQRGISASLMHEVIVGWARILQLPPPAHADDTGWEDTDLYAQYGLPTLKAFALATGLPNPIGDDTGSEAKYAG